MKRILLIAIFAFTLSSFMSACAEETPPEFAFLLDGTDTPITLATLPEEAVALLGEDTQYREETLESIGVFFTIVNDSGLCFAGTECTRIALSYYNDDLLMIACYMTADALPNPQPLIDELNLRYGEGTENIQTNDPLSFLSPIADWTWMLGKDIRLEYYHEAEGAAFAHMLVFANLPVSQQLENAYANLYIQQQTENTAGA